MKKYLEFQELTQEADKTPKLLKVEVKSLEKAKEKVKIEEQKLPWPELKYIKRFHVCKHLETGEKENQPCEVSQI